ncbi:MAG: hypothetical protein canaca05_00560 [Anaerolineaceae bacterium]
MVKCLAWSGECAACPSGTVQEHRLNLSFLPLNQPYLLSSLGIFLLGALEDLIDLSISRLSGASSKEILLGINK